MSNSGGPLEEDDTIGTVSDPTEEYEPYLSNLENSYDICISIDFVRQRLEIADEYIKENEDSNNNTNNNNMDSAHCFYLLSSVLPKSVEFLCKTDLNNLYDQDIIQYQKTNCAEYTTNSSECREFLVSKIEKYFEYIMELILRLKPKYTKEFYDVLKDIFMLTHRIYKPHNGWIDRLSEEYRQQIMDECSGKYAECNSMTLKQYHPYYMKLINYFGDKSGFTIILHEMLDGKRSKKKNKEDVSDEGDECEDTSEEDVAPSTLTHHALQCYIIALACINRFLLPSIKEAIASHMFEAVEHWYLTMPITTIKQYPRSQIHAILRKLYYLLSELSNASSREEYIVSFEYLRLEIACKWLLTDSLERKITAWKEFKEYIDTTQRKYDIVHNPHKYSAQNLASYSYCKNPKSVAIYYINCSDVAKFLDKKNVLSLFLAEDVHEELLKKSFDILYFLGWYDMLNKSDIKMLWSHSIEKTSSFVNTVYVVLIDLFGCLSWELVEYILNLIINIDLCDYNDKIINLIASFCNKCLYRSTSNSKDTVPLLIAEWHCGLKLLWVAMQSSATNNEIQQLAQTKLVFCLQSDSGAVHQEYCKNLCVENLRCSRSVGTSLRVLQHIISAHDVCDDIEQNGEECEEKDESELTRSEIIHALEKQHGIINLFFQDLSRYMSYYSSKKEECEGDRVIVNFRARFDFLRFILQFSSLRLSVKQLDDLWDIVIGDTLNYTIPDSYKLEQNYFFKWLGLIIDAISIDSAINLFDTKLGSMPRKTMTSDSLQCLHEYFDLVYALDDRHSSALDVMWEIAIEAETDTVAQSCGVFILSFYMKAIKSNICDNIGDNILNLINKVETAEVINNINKWEGRTSFVSKCMDYISSQSNISRCLDLLETFIECTRPGVMSNMMCSDDRSPWDLGPYAITNWKLPIGATHFICISIVHLQNVFSIMISKYSRIGELQDLIAAIFCCSVGLLQMQTSQVSLTPQMSSSRLESCGIIDGCSITVMSIFSNNIEYVTVPDGAAILSQNRLYISVLLDLLSSSCIDIKGRIWNLLMRLPFNLSFLQSLRDIASSSTVNWNIFIDSSSTFKLLYSLQSFDCVVQHCNVSWLDSFIMLSGLQHIYYTLINFKFDYTDNVCLYASYRSLYMLLKIFASLTSHELIASDPLFSRCKPRHSTPSIIKIRTVSGVLSLFNDGSLSVSTLGNVLFSLILSILSSINKNNNNILLAEIIELALYCFMSLLFLYSSQLNMDKWNAVLLECLFCLDNSVRNVVVKPLYIIFVKCNNNELQLRTLSLLFNQLMNEFNHNICSEYFEFYGLVIRNDSALQYAFDALRSYRVDDCYLNGLLSLISNMKIADELIADLKNELIYECLFAVSDNIYLTIRGVHSGAKCALRRSRSSAFNLLLVIASSSASIWNEILISFSSILSCTEIEFGFNPSYSKRGLQCGLHNYGCTCYMNATMQQLYCNPVVRKVVLGVDLRELSLNKESVFYAMQTMFSNLLWSDRRAIWPRDFLSNYRDFEGNKIDPNEQMDAHEFFNFLFDNLERELGGTIAESILKNEFCGSCVNQVICQECGYVSETHVPMYAVSCKIENDSSLEESLQDVIRSDWLKGGNAYRCSKCNKKVTALKRSCFEKLSNTMLVHLQRFEFNLETMLKVKINSELRFPLKLNMKKYTKEYIATNETKEEYLYDLVGITVHSGMADIGHYYSFIRQQTDDGHLGQWLSFNDDYVHSFDIKTMNDKCFGGNKLTLINNKQRWIPKSNNAYILVYRRSASNNLSISDEYLTSKQLKLNDLYQSQTKKEITNQHHLYQIAEAIHKDNTQFTKMCQLCDMDLVYFLDKFIQLKHNEYCHKLPINRYKSDEIRSRIGSKRTKLILYFIWDILCKFETATKTEINDEKTKLEEWCQTTKKLFENDVQSSYQFIYILSNSEKRIWLTYLLSAKNVTVRLCLCDLIISAIKSCIHLERPLYYIIQNTEYLQNTKQEWFTSASIIVHLLDQMCCNILIATNHWRRLTQFWLFFKLFAQLGNQEKQLLLDRHLIIECYRFYCNKKPFEYGLKQLIEKDNTISNLNIKYDRRKMGSNDSEPDVHNMTAMLSMIICSCAPPTHKKNYPLPYNTLEPSVSSLNNKLLIMPSADKRLLNDPKIWMKFLEDQQNPTALAKIISHLCWRNNDLSKKTCKALVNYLEEYHDNVYQSCFTVLKSLLAMDDYREEEEKEKEITLYAHLRIDRTLTPIIKIQREWYRDNKYMQSIAKIAQFIDDIAQTNDNVANYFRNKYNDTNIQWLKQFLNSHSYYLNLPHPPNYQ